MNPAPPVTKIDDMKQTLSTGPLLHRRPMVGLAKRGQAGGLGCTSGLQRVAAAT